MRKNWIRGLALCLTLALLVSVVAALSFDLNKDGKTNVASTKPNNFKKQMNKTLDKFEIDN